MLNSMQTETASEEARVLGEECWLFGGFGGRLPSVGTPSAVAMVIIVVGGLVYVGIGILVRRETREVTRL